MKILILRFSSFGDVLQTLSVAGRLGEDFPQSEIHWVTRAEFAPLIEPHPRVNRVWSIPKGAGFGDLWQLARELKKQNFTHIYDAHNNLRSHLISAILNGFLAWRVWTGRHRFLRRSIYRWKRFLLFRFHKNLFPKPFSGQFALLEPLKAWGASTRAPAPPQLFFPTGDVERAVDRLPFKEYVTLAPSAAFPLKRWPLEHFKALIQLVPDTRFVVLGGPADNFVQELVAVDPARVLNFAGKLSLEESALLVAGSRALVRTTPD